MLSTNRSLRPGHGHALAQDAVPALRFICRSDLNVAIARRSPTFNRSPWVVGTMLPLRRPWSIGPSFGVFDRESHEGRPHACSPLSSLAPNSAHGPPLDTGRSMAAPVRPPPRAALASGRSGAGSQRTAPTLRRRGIGPATKCPPFAVDSSPTSVVMIDVESRSRRAGTPDVQPGKGQIHSARRRPTTVDCNALLAGHELKVGQKVNVAEILRVRETRHCASLRMRGSVRRTGTQD